MTSTNQPTNQRTNKQVLITNKPTNQLTSLTNLIILFLAISCLLTATAYAADFAGSLKGVTITDSAGTNAPPTAVVNFTQNGDIVDFDASASTDPDGTITDYRWDFGDGTTGVGAVVSHQFATVGSFPVTLTTVDDGGGIGILQQVVDTSGGAVFYWSMDSLPVTSMISDFGDVTITKNLNDAASGIGVKGNSMEQTGLRQAYTIPLNTVPAVKGRIQFYAKHDNIADASYRYFFKSTNIGGANTIYAYTYKTYIFFYLYDSAGNLHRVYQAGALWNIGTWYKYEFTWNSETGYLGISRDGVLLVETTQAPWSASVWDINHDLFIGETYPIGSFDEFSIYNQ